MSRARPGTTSRRKEPLDRGRIVDAAVRLTKRTGLENITMRAVAEELGVTTMAAYHYVDGKDQLLALTAQRILGQVEPVPAGDTWEGWMRSHAIALYETLADHPGVAQYLLDRPLGEVARGQAHDAHQVLEGAGFPERDAALGWATYHTYVFGLVAMEARFRPLKRRGRDRAILVDVPPEEFVDFGIETIIAGLRERLAQPRSPTPQAPRAQP